MTEQYNHPNAGQKPLAADEPIAVVGLACRFPGADDVNAFWKLLGDGPECGDGGCTGVRSGTGWGVIRPDFRPSRGLPVRSLSRWA